jgi:hypothetical protein
MPNDPRHLDATLNNIRAAARDLDGIVAYITKARGRLAAAPEAEREAAERHLANCELRMRADAVVLAHNLAALSLPAGAVPT